MSRWYRAYEGTVTDPKLGEVALVAGCSRSVAIATWHAILESCAVTNDGGRFEATPRRIAVALGEPVATIEAAFAEMASLGMIGDGCVEAWSKRQFESDNSSERSRKSRARSRNGDATLQQRCATAGGRDATHPYTDTDTDTDSCAETRAPAREADAVTADLRQAIVVEFQRANSPVIPDTSRAAVWLAKGWRPEIIIPTIAEILAKNPNARSLAYFEPAIADAHAPAAARAPPAGRPPNRPLTMIDGLIAHDARQAARTDR